jgi:hypothetical protein
MDSRLRRNDIKGCRNDHSEVRLHGANIRKKRNIEILF